MPSKGEWAANRIIQVEDGWATTNGNVSKGFLHLEIRILEGKDLEALSILCPSWELTVEGPSSRRQTFQITQLHCGSWHITCCINSDLKSPTWEEFCPYKATHVVEQLLWLMMTSLSVYPAVDTFMEVGIWKMRQKKSKKGKEERKVGLWAVKPGAWGEGTQDGER